MTPDEFRERMAVANKMHALEVRVAELEAELATRPTDADLDSALDSAVGHLQCRIDELEAQRDVKEHPPTSPCEVKPMTKRILDRMLSDEHREFVESKPALKTLLNVFLASVATLEEEFGPSRQYDNDTEGTELERPVHKPAAWSDLRELFASALAELAPKQVTFPKAGTELHHKERGICSVVATQPTAMLLCFEENQLGVVTIEDWQKAHHDYSAKGV